MDMMCDSNVDCDDFGILQYFVNKLRYAKEGARDIMDRTCADLPWQVWLEVDGQDIQIPKDAEGLIVLNIGSYMGGVDLWQNDYEHDDQFSHQYMHDKMLEVVCISGAWHLGQLKVRFLLRSGRECESSVSDSERYGSARLDNFAAGLELVGQKGLVAMKNF
ncbi:hypothetical protein POM88_038280 [Heracleum sosnowskyi]|uniref:Diacylglycerol kinase accessory domain-containing protein n=1 Tax=Heracleum sosnowskyi TaxID=360622 RepID=A0AAD8HSQ4_9APIA|nr:hypothetical protein POM88_038280 [Heracleum sosnowskyi]